jgi:hypothetical protein
MRFTAVSLSSRSKAARHSFDSRTKGVRWILLLHLTDVLLYRLVLLHHASNQIDQGIGNGRFRMITQTLSQFPFRRRVAPLLHERTGHEMTPLKESRIILRTPMPTWRRIPIAHEYYIVESSCYRHSLIERRLTVTETSIEAPIKNLQHYHSMVSFTSGTYVLKLKDGADRTFAVHGLRML